MPVRLTKSQAKLYGIKPTRAHAVTPREKWGGYASSWEREYAAFLTQDAMVRSWQYEAIRLILAPRTTYLPDFFVITFRGKLEMHEVKGYAREAGMIRLKVAARLFSCFKFILVRKVNGMWERKEI